ncbi:hypothetical protein DID88_010045 [Monilinia fructigena]|uniref:Uncharacterized protein n=1 Tax=Monilinia fructigena TaxID=38457 RepID=A0A395IKZ6_9HELO|nr:hypothetical protein DID88_010045 [Monilinia fructigena]
MEGFSRTHGLLNPFARPIIHLPSMTRRGITAWAHDIIDELQVLGILNTSNKRDLDDLVRLYRNLQQFFDWVFHRPRIIPGQVHRSFHPVMESSRLLVSLHKIWDDLKWDLREEKDGAFIDQMIDHLGWLWNIKSNLKNRTRHDHGLLLVSSMDTLAEAASTYFIGCRYLHPMAPASKMNPRNVEVWVPGTTQGGEQASNNMMSPTRASSYPVSFMRGPKTGHIKLPNHPQISQDQARNAMRCLLSSYNNTPLSKSSLGVQHSLSSPREEAPRNLVDLVDDDNDDILEDASIPHAPIDSTVSIPPTRDSRNLNRTQGSAGGLNYAMTSMTGAKPTHISGNGHSGNSSNFDRGMEKIQSGYIPFHSHPKKMAFESTDQYETLVVESPSPEPVNLRKPKYLSANQRYISSSTSPRGYELPKSYPSAEVPRAQARTTSSTMQSDYLTSSWTPIYGQKNNVHAGFAELRKSKGRSMDQGFGEQEGNAMEGSKVAGSTSTGGTQDDIRSSQNTRMEKSWNATAAVTATSPNYISPYPGLLNQEQTSSPYPPTNLAPNDNPTVVNSGLTKTKNTIDIYRPFSMRKTEKKDGPGEN